MIILVYISFISIICKLSFPIFSNSLFSFVFDNKLRPTLEVNSSTLRQFYITRNITGNKLSSLKKNGQSSLYIINMHTSYLGSFYDLKFS